MFKKTAPVLLLGSVMLAVSCASMAQDKGGGSKGGTSVVPTVAGSGNVSIGTLIERYTPLAGSAANATSLVNGLRSGSEISLTAKASVLVKDGCERYEDRAVTMTSRNPVTGRTMEVPVIDFATGQPKMERVAVKYDCLQDQEVTEKFTPPTGSMGLGNVDIALALTQGIMTRSKISKPDPKQLYAALMGPDGILQQRARGTGWGEIAKSLGLELK